jgi:hypothetical protein
MSSQAIWKSEHEPDPRWYLNNYVYVSAASGPTPSVGWSGGRALSGR